MFGYKRKTILTVGSEELGLISFVTNDYNEIQIQGALFQEYSGYQNGEFLCVEELFPTISKLIENFQIRFGKKIRRLFVGFPGEFSYIDSKDIVLDINKSIRAEDIEEMFLIGDTYSDNNNFTNIDKISVFYKTNCNPHRLINPINQICDRVVGQLSYILCERYFCHIFDELSARLNIKVSYVPTIFASIKYLNKHKRLDELADNFYLDLGYLSSTIACSIGEGIMYSQSFSLGGGNVAGDITLVMNIPFFHGYALYKKLNLNLRPQSKEAYTLFADGQVYRYDIDQINAIAEERIYNIANYIKKAIDSCPFTTERNTPIFTGGSSLCEVPGTKEIIESVCDRPVEIVRPHLLGWDKAEYFSHVAMMEFIK